MRKAQKNSQVWLERQARKIMNDLRVKEAFLYMPGSFEIYQKFAEDIRQKLYKMSAATRGEIADLAGVHCLRDVRGAFHYLQKGDRFPDLAKGRGLLTQVAVEAIVVRMYELLREEQAQREHDSVHEQHDLTGRGLMGHVDTSTFEGVS